MCIVVIIVADKRFHCVLVPPDCWPWIRVAEVGLAEVELFSRKKGEQQIFDLKKEIYII